MSFWFGGDERIRTADLPRARRTLYQLSYTPLNLPIAHHTQKRIFSMVGLSRLERLTSPLSAGCSNHLSYRPHNLRYLAVYFNGSFIIHTLLSVTMTDKRISLERR